MRSAALRYRLPPRQQDVLLRACRGESLALIASEHGVEEETVRKQAALLTLRTWDHSFAHAVRRLLQDPASF